MTERGNFVVKKCTHEHILAEVNNAVDTTFPNFQELILPLPTHVTALHKHSKPGEYLLIHCILLTLYIILDQIKHAEFYNK